MKEESLNKASISKVSPTIINKQRSTTANSKNNLDILKDKRDRLSDKKQVKFDQQVDRAIKHISNQHYAEAINLLKEIILMKKFLDKHEFMGMGNHQSWNGFYPKGPIQLFQVLRDNQQLSRNPFDLLSLTVMIGQHTKQIAPEQVKAVYSELEGFRPRRHEIYFILANFYYNNYQLLQAQKYYERALKLKKHEKTYEYLAWIKDVFNQDQIAVQYSNKCLEINSRNRGALFVKAVCHEDFKQIGELLKKLSHEFPDYYRIYPNIAYYSKDFEDNSQQATEYIKKAFSYNPNYMITHVRNAHKVKGSNPNLARRLLKNALQIDPESVEVFYMLGSLEHELKNYSLAEEYYQKCLALNPYCFLALWQLIEDSQSDDAFQKTVVYCQTYIKLNPYNGKAYAYLGQAQRHLDRISEAEQSFKLGLKINSKEQKCWRGLGDVHHLNGNYKKAIDCYLSANMIKQSADTAYMLGLCYHYLDNEYQARQWGLKCIDLGGDQKQEVFEFLGDVQIESKNINGALQWYFKHVIIRQELNTEYIAQELETSHFQQQQIIKKLNEQLHTLTQEDENIFSFLQLAHLYFHFRKQKLAFEALQITKKIAEEMKRNNQNVHETITNELNKHFGNPDEGYYDIRCQARFEKLLKQYGKKFKQCYTVKQPKAKSCKKK